MSLLQKIGLGMLLIFAVGCANQQKNMRAPELSSALALKGKTADEVRSALGEPSDRDGDQRFYYFLQEESSHHPNPEPKLYAFVFSNKKLLKVELATGR